MSSTAVSTAITELEQITLPLCETYLYEGIRHLERNCAVECDEEGHGYDSKLCNRPHKHDGARMAALINLIPDLLNEIAELKAQLRIPNKPFTV